MHNVEAMWSVEFVVPEKGSIGAGVLIIEGGRLYGGDSSYYYVGTCTFKDGLGTFNVKVKHFWGQPNNVFGYGILEKDLILVGKADYQEFVIQGDGVNVRLKRIEELPG